MLASLLPACAATPAPSSAPAATSSAAAAPPPPTSSAPVTPPAVVTPDARAKEVLGLLRKEDFAAAVALFDTKMTAALPADKLGPVWRGLLEQAGAVSTCEEPRVAPAGRYTLVVVRCKLERASIDVKVTLDTDQRVAGLFFVPTQPPWAPPAYAGASSEREVTVGAEPWALPGTLTMPEGAGPFPAVVLVHGSGPGDRDESVGVIKPFKDLALGLAAQGIAVLRYEKRTRVHAAKIVMDGFTVQEETVDDAVLAAQLLRKTQGIDPRRIVVIGHSLGGELVPRIGKRDPALAGLVSLAGSTRPLAELVVEQTRYLVSVAGPVTPEGQAKIDEATRSAARLREVEAGAQAAPGELVFGAPASYWRDLRGYDAPAEAAKLRIPIFVLQGGRDYQVTEADFRGWQKALGKSPRAKLSLYPKLNHLFVAGEGKSVPAEYQVMGHVDAEIVRDVAAWIKKLSPGR